MISDNGVQCISAVMQQVCKVLDVLQSLIPFYYPEANSVKLRNIYLKTKIATLSPFGDNNHCPENNK
jgi:hypothetical protein